VVITTDALAKRITATFKAPSTSAGVNIYLFLGGSAFAGQPDPTTAAPPPGYVAVGNVVKDTATLNATVQANTVYTLYFYTSQSANSGRDNVQTAACVP
jgi:hypothetical protein